ncbi:class I SAM-dependent methyltransferase [Litoricolaceae bacterium]|nr:class I SAM-dependent methyltransferase [Litorivicinaceae bacterium]
MNKRYEDLINAAKNLSHLDTRINLLRQIVNEFPASIEAYGLLAIAEREDGSHHQSANDFVVWAALQGMPPRASAEAAMGYHQAQLWMQAIRLFEMGPFDDLTPMQQLLYVDCLRQDNDILRASALLDQMARPKDENLASYIRLKAYLGVHLNRPAEVLQEDSQLGDKVDLNLKGNCFYVDQLIQTHMTLNNWTQVINLIEDQIISFPTDSYYRDLLDALNLYLFDKPAQYRNRDDASSRKQVYESAAYLKGVASNLVMVGNVTQMYELIASLDLVDGSGLEFGVRHGFSLNVLARLLPSKQFYGFDSFVGLPVDWHTEPAGSYSVGGKAPVVEKNVTLIGGWFSDTVSYILDQEIDVSLIHVDCDLYESTIEALRPLAASSKLKPGTVILFDEYLTNLTWQADEFKAFQEIVQEFKLSYEYLAFGLITKQCLVRIK